MFVHARLCSFIILYISQIIIGCTVILLLRKIFIKIYWQEEKCFYVRRKNTGPVAKTMLPRNCVTSLHRARMWQNVRMHSYVEKHNVFRQSFHRRCGTARKVYIAWLVNKAATYNETPYPTIYNETNGVPNTRILRVVLLACTVRHSSPLNV